MQSTALSVENYFTEIPRERLNAYLRIKKLCLQNLDGYTETLRYGMPCYEKNNMVEVGFVGQKNNIALSILKQDVMGEL